MTKRQTGCSRLKKKECVNHCEWTVGKGCKSKSSQVVKLFNKEQMKQILFILHPNLNMASSFETSCNIFFFNCAKYILRGSKNEFDVEDVLNGFQNDGFEELHTHFSREARKVVTNEKSLFYNMLFVTKIKKAFNKELTKEAAFALAGGLEYLCAELCDLSGNVALHKRKVRVTDKFMEEVFQSDEEFTILRKLIS
jgi:hypothetical protein